jgi:hypothetical protein
MHTLQVNTTCKGLIWEQIKDTSREVGFGKKNLIGESARGIGIGYWMEYWAKSIN